MPLSMPTTMAVAGLLLTKNSVRLRFQIQELSASVLTRLLTAPDRITLTLEIEIDSNRESNDSNDDSNLAEKEARVITALHKNSNLNATQVAAETGLSVFTVNRVYKSLKNKNYIARESLTRGKWIILK